MKTLKTIQVLAKIGKIISKIVFICSIVGFCLCVLGIVSLAAGGTLIKIGGVTVRGLIENNAGIPLHELYASMIVGVFICAAEAVLSKFAGIYFKNELEAGTPFTLEGAKELMRLGILAVAIPLGTAIVCSIIIGVMNVFFPGVDKISVNGFSSVGIGIMMIVMSLVCRHGTELNSSGAQGGNAES